MGTLWKASLPWVRRSRVLRTAPDRPIFWALLDGEKTVIISMESGIVCNKID